MELKRDNLSVLGLQDAIRENYFLRLDSLKIKIIDECNLRCPKCYYWRPSYRHNLGNSPCLSEYEWTDIAIQATNLGLQRMTFFRR